MDENGIVNMKDVMILFGYVSGNQVIDNPERGDINCDGIVNTRDSMVLYKSVSGAA